MWIVLNSVDREIFTCKNIRLLNFRVVLFSSPRHTGSVASFLLSDVEKYLIFVVVGYQRKFINDENFPIYSNGYINSSCTFCSVPTQRTRRQTEGTNVEVIIGNSNQQCGRTQEVCNGPLSPATQYRVRYRLITENGMSQDYPFADAAIFTTGNYSDTVH